MNHYVASSTLVRDRGEQELELATARGLTPAGVVDHPVFFSGFLARPDVAAAGLLAVADVAAARYADAGLMQRLANLDPVVTASGDRLRFESFSACNGVYARLDLLADGLDAGTVGFGTTNVDVNQPLRTALARIGPDEPLHLSVGHDELRASSLGGTHVERKVRLPDRWVRGLAEVPTLSAAMTEVGHLPGPGAARFVSGLPRSGPPGPTAHVVVRSSTWRLAGVPVPGSVPLAGTARLRGCRRVLRHARRLTVHLAGNGTTGWAFELPGARFTLVVSPDPFRGFSGEGTLLRLLTHPEAEAVGRRLLGHLEWSASIDPEALRARTGLRRGDVDAGLAWLAASGRLGHDLAEGDGWFHRELPIDAEKVLRRMPRLVSAQRLVADGGVQRRDRGWRVRGSLRDHYDLTQDLTCGCPWAAEHGDGRGPCKHVLAVLIALRE